MPDLQTPNDKLDHIEIEDAILHFQVDNGLEPNGEIEHSSMKASEKKIDPDDDKRYGFHKNLKSSTDTIRKFDPKFEGALAKLGGEAPPGTMQHVDISLPLPLRTADDRLPSPSLDREIYDGQRFVPVRFSRWASGKFEPLKPETDERGYHDRRFGPVVSLMVGETIKVKLDRVHISPSAKLFFRSTDENIVKVDNNSDVVELTGVTGSGSSEHPKEAQIEVRFSSENGPVLHRLYVEVYDEIKVAVTFHFVSIKSTTEAGKKPELDKQKFQSFFEKVNEVWRSAGISFDVKEGGDKEITLEKAGAVRGEGEKNAVFGLDNESSFLKVFFVSSFDSPHLGSGRIGKGLLVAYHDQGSVDPLQDHVMIHVLAHEIGHVLGLNHPGTFDSNGDSISVEVLVNGFRVPEDHSLQDYWSRRMLMYTNGFELKSVNARVDVNVRQRGRQSDVGYGLGNIGKMLCCRVVPQILSSTSDSEIVTARRAALIYQVKASGAAAPAGSSGQNIFS